MASPATVNPKHAEAALAPGSQSTKPLPMAHTDLTLADAIAAIPASFILQDLLKACPGVSPDLIRKTLSKLQRAGELESQGRGPGAIWKKKENSPKNGKKSGN